jgi:hypothetical protein
MKTDALGTHSDKLFVELTTGEKLEITIHWNLIEKPIFEPRVEKYLLIALQPKENRDFQIIYNEDAGGKIKNMTTSSSELSIVGHKRHQDSIYIKLKYIAGNIINPGVSAGELIVETEDGKTHKVGIFIS